MYGRKLLLLLSCIDLYIILLGRYIPIKIVNRKHKNYL